MTRAERLRADLVASRDRLSATLERVGEEDFTRRPAPAVWSVAHVCEHLARVDQAVARGIGAALAGKLVVPSHWADPFRRMVYFSNLYRVIRVRTAPALDPAEVLPRPEALARLAAARATLLAAMEGADAEALSRLKLRHLTFGPLSMGHMLGFVSLHEDRHRAQIGRIRAALGRARD